MTSFGVVGWPLIRCHLFAFDRLNGEDDIFMAVLKISSFMIFFPEAGFQQVASTDMLAQPFQHQFIRFLRIEMPVDFRFSQFWVLLF